MPVKGAKFFPWAENLNFPPFTVNNLHRVLGYCWFQWWGFHSFTFSKNCPKIQLLRFLLHNRRNSFTHAFLVTNDFSAADMVHADFCHKKRTGQGPGVLLKFSAHVSDLAPFLAMGSNVSFIPNFVFGFWTLLATKLQK